ncbi:MAG: ATP-binding cassette domain-containing protein [Burkholderiaceae bacterium]|nr:ATP-binding cassette domain-containing protein [Burkholderiaceae bacterium]
MTVPLLSVQGLVKQYQRGWLAREISFDMRADFEVAAPAIVGVMGANGAGKTTMFELITGGNQPTAGRVLVAGQDVHNVRYAQRDRLALHYHQSYQVRAFRRTKPSFMLERARSERALVHLFDEPQFNTQDGYIGFMLDFFRRLRAQGKLVFLCLHPNDPVHLDILDEVCDRYMFMRKDEQRRSRLLFADTLRELAADPSVSAYLGRLMSRFTGEPTRGE